MFNVDSGLILWEIITFILLLIVLRLYAWKPLSTALKKREQSIRQAIDNADQARRDAESVLKASLTALRQTEADFTQLRQRCEPFVTEIKNSALEAALRQTDRILNDAGEEIRRMKEHAIQQVRAEIGGLVVDCAADIVDRALDAPRHRILVEEALASLSVSCASILDVPEHLDHQVRT